MADQRVIRNKAATTDIVAIRSRYFQALDLCGGLFSRVIHSLHQIYWAIEEKGRR